MQQRNLYICSSLFKHITQAPFIINFIPKSQRGSFTHHISNAGVQELDESQHDNNILGYNILNEGFYWKNSWFY